MSLEHIAKEAAALDSEISQANQIPDVAAEQAQAAAVELSEGNARLKPVLKQFLGLGVVGTSQLYPVVRQFFTPQQVEDIASSIINLADEYGLQLETFIGKGGGKLMAWLDFGMNLGVPLFLCIQATKKAEDKPVPEKEVPGETEKPPVDTSGLDFTKG